jgi:tripartite-type tricarboxylate transporter receptor subunit TctC
MTIAFGRPPRAVDRERRRALTVNAPRHAAIGRAVRWRTRRDRSAIFHASRHLARRASSLARRSRARLCLRACGTSSAADEYPNKPIHLLAGSLPAAASTISCRHWAQELSTRVGQPVVVENKPGASGEIAVKAMIASNPDGYTLACLSGSNTISSSKPNAPFDILKDVAPVHPDDALHVRRVRESVAAGEDLPELVAYAQEQSRQAQLRIGGHRLDAAPRVRVAEAGHGREHRAQCRSRGTSQAMSAVLSGEVQVGLDAIAA